MPKQPEQVVCARCQGPALRIEVRKYFWRKKKDVIVPIENADIVKCQACGEYPATPEEGKRWVSDENRQEAAERDPDEMCCSGCGKPMSLTGQFFHYGREIGYCRECNDTVGPGA